MAKVINLSRARKRARKQAADAQADANAIRHGRTRADRAAAADSEARLRSIVDGARREPTADADPTVDEGDS